MPATFGVTNQFGLAPDTGHVSQSSEDSSVDVATIRDENGITKYAGPRKLVTKTQTISGKGTVSLDDVAPGIVSLGTAMITSVRQSESNDDFPEFEIQATTYTELS